MIAGMHDIRSLIRAYNAAAAEAIADLRNEYPAFTDALSLRAAGIPRDGVLASGRVFSFHGIGCRFEKNGMSLDVDFGPHGRSDGFDAWRLSLFAQEVGAEVTRDEIQNSLDAMLSSRELLKSAKGQLDSHLYYWPS
jgi:hypothetical protein